MFDVMDFSIYEHLPYIISGTLLGYIAGLIPGVGNTIMLLISYPLILNESLLNMLLFYVALISVSQFSGSIVATVFGVPGESSSMPAVLRFVPPPDIPPPLGARCDGRT